MSGWTSSSGGTYWVGRPPAASKRITTSPTEIGHATIAFLVLTLDIAILESGLVGSVSFGSFSPSVLVAYLPFGAAAALTGFLLHEMAHKVSAERRGFWAEFRMAPVGLLLSLITALFGFLFAAPGATVIGGMGSAEDWGKTSLAGPALNLVEGVVFAAVGIGLAFSSFAGLAIFFLLLAFINGWFATFNLIPLGPLDGRKVLRWSRPIWGAAFAISAAFTVLLYLISAVGFLGIT